MRLHLRLLFILDTLFAAAFAAAFVVWTAAFAAAFAAAFHFGQITKAAAKAAARAAAKAVANMSVQIFQNTSLTSPDTNYYQIPKDLFVANDRCDATVRKIDPYLSDYHQKI